MRIILRVLHIFQTRHVTLQGVATFWLGRCSGFRACTPRNKGVEHRGEGAEGEEGEKKEEQEEEACQSQMSPCVSPAKKVKESRRGKMHSTQSASHSFPPRGDPWSLQDYEDWAQEEWDIWGANWEKQSTYMHSGRSSSYNPNPKAQAPAPMG